MAAKAIGINQLPFSKLDQDVQLMVQYMTQIKLDFANYVNKESLKIQIDLVLMESEGNI